MLDSLPVSFNEITLLAIFSGVIIFFLIIDLGFLHKNPEKITYKSALNQTIFWIAISLLFGLLIYLYDGGSEAALEYFSAYLTEKALSVDNIFVIIIILQYFRIKESHYHKILFWGILGAIIFRAIFIFVGAFLVGHFHWILYIFGFFLVFSGIKILFQKSDDHPDPAQNPLVKLSYRFLKITKGDFGGKFWVKRNKAIYFTPLFLVMLLIETTDIIFAVDSIPAAFAITQNEFIIFTSNIFAVMGLRAMFFMLAGIITRFYLLQKALSLILIFIGMKMLLEFFHVEIPVSLSFAVIIISLTGAIILSILIPAPKPATNKIVK